MITVATADNVLKTYYLDAVKEQLDLNSNPFLAEISKASVDVAGRGVAKCIRLGMSGGIGAGNEDADLPMADDSNYLCLTQDLKNLFGNIRISDKAVKASKTNDGAFVDILDEEMKFLLKSACFNLDRMLFGDGSGKLADIALVRDNFISVLNINNLYEGMCIDIYNSSGELIHKGRRIVCVNKDNNNFSVDGEPLEDFSLGHGSFCTIQGSYNKEINGLGTVFSNSSTIYGVDRAKSSCLRGYKKTSFGEVSELKIMQVLDDLEMNTGSKPNFILCSIGVRRAIVNMFAENKRYVDTMELKGGYKAVSFNGIPIVADRFCPSGTMYFLNTEDFCLYQLGDWDWISGENDKVLKQVPGKPVYEATLVKYLNLMCFNPSAQAMVTGVTEA